MTMLKLDINSIALAGAEIRIPDPTTTTEGTLLSHLHFPGAALTLSERSIVIPTKDIAMQVETARKIIDSLPELLSCAASAMYAAFLSSAMPEASRPDICLGIENELGILVRAATRQLPGMRYATPPHQLETGELAAYATAQRLHHHGYVPTTEPEIGRVRWTWAGTQAKPF